MSFSTSLTAFLEERQSHLTAAFEAGDVDKILAFYDPELDFSDHAWHATHLTLSQFHSFLDSTYTSTSSLRMETHSVTGTSKEFCVWEWTLRVMAGADDPIRGLVKGKEIVLRGASLHWWKLRDGEDGDGEKVRDWRIVREADYACGGSGGH
ncbi:hypothetical protein BDV96DRAFT_639773 [Lophiotrema nucula]|uniref:SnoaL-like domain-containing protein n=1 Tax=Lophiotrema nucula TaxID=690887 RepID=A0A6A5ZWA9_9PLEO|nr:hypothetical protein BDV96DRAFT_639773 [Lophiotrema nucula]